MVFGFFKKKDAMPQESLDLPDLHDLPPLPPFPMSSTAKNMPVFTFEESPHPLEDSSSSIPKNPRLSMDDMDAPPPFMGQQSNMPELTPPEPPSSSRVRQESIRQQRMMPPPMMPLASPSPPSSPLVVASTSSKNLFVKMEKYDDVMATLDLVGKRVKESKELLDSIRDLEEKKTNQFEAWRSKLDTIQKKLMAVDRTLFEA
ncbi:hypothetical protein HZB02_06790 [Candidatus Woesearchaeota archaeon]|nr:hypothetical protein [Candidatus Woesearchaeota archaeon]